MNGREFRCKNPTHREKPNPACLEERRLRLGRRSMLAQIALTGFYPQWISNVTRRVCWMMPVDEVLVRCTMQLRQFQRFYDRLLTVAGRVENVMEDTMLFLLSG